MKKIFPDEAERALECAKAIGSEAVKYTEWYIDQVNNHGLLNISYTSNDSIDVFLNSDIDDILSGKVEYPRLLATEALFKEFNAMNDAPDLPLPDDF
jgi:hypothetical protein